MVGGLGVEAVTMYLHNWGPNGSVAPDFDVHSSRQLTGSLDTKYCDTSIH